MGFSILIPRIEVEALDATFGQSAMQSRFSILIPRIEVEARTKTPIASIAPDVSVS